MSEDASIKKAEEASTKREWNAPKITRLEVSKTLSGPSPTAFDGVGPISA